MSMTRELAFGFTRSATSKSPLAKLSTSALAANHTIADSSSYRKGRPRSRASNGQVQATRRENNNEDTFTPRTSLALPDRRHHPLGVYHRRARRGTDALLRTVRQKHRHGCPLRQRQRPLL